MKKMSSHFKYTIPNGNTPEILVENWLVITFSIFKKLNRSTVILQSQITLELQNNDTNL